MIMTKDILSLLSPLVSAAEKNGANEVEFYALDRSDKTIDFENSSLKSASANIVQGVGIRVLVNKSLGFTSVNSFDGNKISEALQDAISIARTTPSEDHYYLSQGSKIKSRKDLFDEETANLSMNEIIDYGKDLLKHIVEIDSRLSIESGLLSSRVDKYAIATSTGIEAKELKSSLYWEVFGWAVDGPDIGSFEAESDSRVSSKDIDLEAGAKMFAEKALQNLKAKKGEAFKGTAIFSPDAARDLFDMLVTSSMATVIQAGSSFLQDKLGASIATSDLTITDNGLVPASPYSGSFDREGVPHTPLDILDSGVYKGVLYNAFTANKDGLASTGHATGGFRTAPNIGPTNIEIESGRHSYDEILSEVERGIYIQRVSMDPDFTSGDFSGVIKGGRLIEHGEIKTTLKEMTVTGNLFEGLKAISGISRERKLIRIRFLNSSWNVPYLRIEDLDFAA
jgi:PmbA protein